MRLPHFPKKLALLLSLFSAIVPCLLALDENSDGFSDVWIWYYNYSLSQDGIDTDVDGDGATAKDEHDFGTSPFDPLSRPLGLRLDLISSSHRPSSSSGTAQRASPTSRSFLWISFLGKISAASFTEQGQA
jgi:hypothetical protein